MLSRFLFAGGVVFAAALLPPCASAQLYKCMRDGKVAYQDSPCPEEAVSRKLPSSFGDVSRATAGGVELIDADAAARRIRGRQGNVVVVLYSSKCPVCREVMPQITDLARRYEGRGIEWEALSTDDLADLEQVPPFLVASRATFAPVVIRPTGPGGLGRAFAPLGMNISDSWAKPYVAVRDASGKVILQAEGVSDLSGLHGAIDAIAKR